MAICYIDCLPLMRELLAELALPDDLPLRVHLGDPSPQQLPALIGDARVIINGHTMVDEAIMAACPKLKTIVYLGTGASSYIDMQAAARLGIEVRTIKGYGDRSIAEHTFALMLGAARRVAAMDRDLRAGIWSALEGVELAGLTLGVIGAGGIGTQMARMALAFGMNVVIWNRSPLADDLKPLARDFDVVLREADVLSLHLALTPETRGLINAAALARLKRGAILVNTARGALVDEAALVAALADGTLAHAALDVFDVEPLPATSPLLALANVTLTSHAAYKTPAASRRLLQMGIEAARQALASRGSP